MCIMKVEMSKSIFALRAFFNKCNKQNQPFVLRKSSLNQNLKFLPMQSEKK